MEGEAMVSGLKNLESISRTAIIASNNTPRPRGYHGYFTKEPLRLRFMRHINLTDTCWLWAGGRDVRGRGRVSVNGKLKLASRVAYEIFNGTIPSGMNVCHTCDNHLCVNPDHLFIGSQFDNIADRENKNRGSANHQKRDWHGRFIENAVT